MRVALHACCAPCLIEPLDALSLESDEIVVVYANPNIHPIAEYERRRDTLMLFAEGVGIEVVELPYTPELWLEHAGPLGARQHERCRACYRLRLGMVSDWAAQAGFDAIATTLTVSPYQDHEGITEEGRRAAESRDIRYLERDYRDRYRRSVERSRELGMYRQNYCGCLMSDVEATAQREARRSSRTPRPST